MQAGLFVNPYWIFFAGSCGTHKKLSLFAGLQMGLLASLHTCMQISNANRVLVDLLVCRCLAHLLEPQTAGEPWIHDGGNFTLGRAYLCSINVTGRTGKRADSKHVCHHLPNVTQRLGSTAGAGEHNHMQNQRVVIKRKRCVKNCFRKSSQSASSGMNT